MTVTMTESSVPEATAACPRTSSRASSQPVPEVAAPPLTLRAAPAAPSYARGYVRRQLRRWGLEGLTEDACTVASELVTNAVAASTSTDVAIEVGHGDGEVVIRVGNEGAGVPSPCLVPPLCESGHGLMIVASLSRRWGWEREENTGGVCVWAVL